jgi:hypothetical protein
MWKESVRFKRTCFWRGLAGYVRSKGDGCGLVFC